MKKIKFYVSLLWKPFLIGLIIFIFSVILLVSNLSSVPGGYSAREVEYFEAVQKGEIIPANPVYLPVYLMHKVILKFFNSGIVSLRIANAFIGLLSVALMYFLVRRWQTTRVALMSCLIFITLTWFLVSTRSALPEVSLLLTISIPLLIVWLQNTKKQKIALLVTAICVGLLLYLPGLIWLLIAGATWKFRSIVYFIKNSPFWNISIAILVFIITIIPIILSLSNKLFIESLSGVSFNDLSIKIFFENIYTFFINILWNSNYNNGINIGSQAVFDILLIVLMTSGMITIIKKWKKSKYKYILFSLLLSIFLIGLGIPQIISLASIILVISIGLSWLMLQWFAVFPRNPFARNIGVVIVFVAVSISSIYNVYRFYVAWPHMPKTEITYNIEI